MTASHIPAHSFHGSPERAGMGGNGPEWVELKLDVGAEFQTEPRLVLAESGGLFAGLSTPTGARGVGEKNLFPAQTAP